jgi:hypothetical protein
MRKSPLFHLTVITACGFCVTVQASTMTGNPDDVILYNSRGSNCTVPQTQLQDPLDELRWMMGEVRKDIEVLYQQQFQIMQVQTQIMQTLFNIQARQLSFDKELQAIKMMTSYNSSLQ